MNDITYKYLIETEVKKSKLHPYNIRYKFGLASSVSLIDSQIKAIAIRYITHNYIDYQKLLDNPLDRILLSDIQITKTNSFKELNKEQILIIGNKYPLIEIMELLFEKFEIISIHNK